MFGLKPESEINHNLSIKDMLRLSTRIFTVKPMRTILTILGTSIGIGTVVFLISLGYGLQYILLGRLVTTEDSLITLEATYPQESNLNISEDDIKSFSAIPDIIEISPLSDFPSEIKIADSPGLISGRIIDSNYFRLSGLGPDMGRQFTDTNPGVIISAQGAKLINLPVAETSLGTLVSVKVYYQNLDGTVQEVGLEKPLPIVGFITNESELPIALIPQSSLVSPPPFYRSFFAKAKDIDSVTRVKDQLTDKGFLISARLDLVNQAQKILNIITMVLGVFGVTALTVSAVGMFNTMVVSFMERTYEVGVMKSLGAMDSDVRNLFLMESLIMGLAGGVTGVLLGYLGGQGVNFILNIVASRLGGKPFTLFITPLWFVLLVIASSSIIGIVSGFWPARRASNLSPKEAFLRK